MLKKLVFVLLLSGIAFAVLMVSSQNADFSRHNSLEMEHPAEAVWGVLVDARNWPQWWPGMERVAFVGEIAEGTRMALFLTGIPDGAPAEVVTAIPLEELSWERDGVLGSLTRTRLILEGSQGGTVVTIESYISGPQAVLARYARGDDFVRYHEVVLRSLKLHLDRGAEASYQENP